jgi:hypothetical protein
MGFSIIGESVGVSVSVSVSVSVGGGDVLMEGSADWLLDGVGVTLGSNQPFIKAYKSDIAIQRSTATTISIAVFFLFFLLFVFLVSFVVFVLLFISIHFRQSSDTCLKIIPLINSISH